MPTDRDRLALDLLDQALTVAEEQRLEFVRSSAGDDVQLVNDVLELLDAHRNAESLLAVPEFAAITNPPDNANSAMRAGQKLANRYEVEQQVGAGGMGEVFRAFDHQLGRLVALKVLSADWANQPEMAKRFEREARSAASLSHANILVLHDILTDQGFMVAVTEYIDGINLRSRISDGLSMDDAIRIARWVALGLDAAHARRMMHRDIKPENIMIRKDGQVKILDFGLARLASPLPADVITQANSPTAGTIPYMSPEQIHGKELETSTDIFSLGSMLYEMLSGVHPFQRENAFETMQAIVQARPAALEIAGQAAPMELRELIDSMLSVDPRQRPSAKHVAQRLQIAMDKTVRLAFAAKPDEPAADVTSVIADSQRPTIAVLPFAVLSNQLEHKVFGEAVAQEIIVEISKLRWLPVIARGSSFQFNQR